MYSRWANFAVIALWLVTMTWLVRAKVLPQLLIGEPPNSQTVLAARGREPLVGWQVCWNHEPIGWALSLTRPSLDGSTEIFSRVHFNHLPLGQLAPPWLRSLVGTLASIPQQIEADAESRLALDGLGQLSRVDSSVRFEPGGGEVSMTGLVQDSRLAVSIRSGELTYGTKIAIDPKALHSEVLSPQTQLPGLHEGQTWTVEVCSPLGYPNAAVEVIEARVVGSEPIIWQDRILDAWLVEYHDPPASRLSKAQEPRGRLWVRPDGTVLVQEISLFSSRLKFVRMSREEALALAKQQSWIPDFQSLTPNP